MVRATLKGVEFTMENPETAYGISEKYVENLAEADSVIQMQVLKESIKLYQTDLPGFSQQDAWQNMHDILQRMELLTKPIDVDAAFSNDYLPVE